MRSRKFLTIILLFAIANSLLFACNSINNSQVSGLTYVAPLGDPSAGSLIWSPEDSTKILVNASSLTSQQSKVYILDTVTKKDVVIADTNNGDIGASAWSPDGKRIALTVGEGSKGFSKSGVWVINIEDGFMENISDKYSAAFWLRNGNMAFQRGDLGLDQNPQISIYLMNVLTDEMKLIYVNQDAIAFSGFSSSPDGEFLVFSQMFDYYRDMDLYLLNLQTGTVNQITQDGGSSFPQWSPNGKLIVYQKWSKIGNKTRSSLHLITPDGKCDIEIPNVGHAASPTWSPDGRKIAFIGEDGIYILDIDIVFGRKIYQGLCP